MAEPRGVRNNNPGNIEYGDFARSRGATGSDGRFAIFPTPEQGIAAIRDLQEIYEGQHGLESVSERIGRWAPAGENNVNAYAQAVARSMGIDANAPFSMTDPRMGQAFITAVIQHENGKQPYATGTIANAYAAAGSRTPAQNAAAGMAAGPADNDVVRAQQALVSSGYDLEVDGVFGPKSQAALLDYLNKNDGRYPSQNNPPATQRSGDDRQGMLDEFASAMYGQRPASQTGTQQGTGTVRGSQPERTPEWVTGLTNPYARGLLGPLTSGAGRALMGVLTGNTAGSGLLAQPATPMAYTDPGTGGGTGGGLLNVPSWATPLNLSNVSTRQTPTVNGNSYEYVTGNTGPQLSLFGGISQGSPVAGYQTNSGNTYAWNTGAAPASSGYGGLDAHDYGLANNTSYQGNSGGGLLGDVGGWFGGLFR